MQTTLFAIYFDMSFHTIISGEWLREGSASDKKGMRRGGETIRKGKKKKIKPKKGWSPHHTTVAQKKT